MKPRVLFIDHTLKKSGAAISLGTLVKSLSSSVESFFVLRKKNEVKDIIGASGRPLHIERLMPQFMMPRSVPQYSPALFLWHMSKVPVAFCTIWHLSRKWKIDLLHLNESTLLAYAFIGKMLGLPVVMHARCPIAQRSVELYFLRILGRLRKTAIVAIDDETRGSFPQQTQGIVRVIHNPIDLGPEPGSKAIEQIRSSWGCSSEDVIIGQVASLHAYKGVWDILELASVLCPVHANVRFLLVGDDRPEAGEGPALKESVAQRGLAGRVLFAGYDSRLSLVYAGLDIGLCLFATSLGGVGRAAYEAAIAGKPLVAMLPNPKTSSTLNNGEEGFIFAPNDQEGILNALRALIQSETMRRELGERARRSIGDRHSPERIASEVLSLYSTLLDPRH